jgi:dihydroorotate dehydrogenase subfamily 2
MISILIPILALVGIVDAAYLTYDHYTDFILPCTSGALVDCGRVLDSEYAILFGIPLAVWGLLHYVVLFLISMIYGFTNRKLFIFLLLAQTTIGLLFSVYFVYLQLIVIQAICLYCMISALNSLALFLITHIIFVQHYRAFLMWGVGILYQIFGKPAFFILDPEFVHNSAMRVGEMFGAVAPVRKLFELIFVYHSPLLEQKIAGLTFHNPVGLSAGYDYEARLTQILPAVGFGFNTVGTITNQPYGGNDKPILGRLLKSKSLMVNKGFKNEGAAEVAERLKHQQFPVPVGISIGVTNSKGITSEKMAIEDIIEAFTTFEKSEIRHTYYEMNISCPNLHTPVSFYNPQSLDRLLKAIDSLQLRRPVFIKMPITESDQEVKAMLQVILKHSVAGIIIGNLQKDRKDPSFAPGEVSRWKHGNFSGKPTWKRSNELIRLAYREVGKKLVIIGCGGIFSPEDAYIKIKAGASMVQLITGMIFTGPQLITSINIYLDECLRRDGFDHISDAVGTEA